MSKKQKPKHLLTYHLPHSCIKENTPDLYLEHDALKPVVSIMNSIESLTKKIDKLNARIEELKDDSVEFSKDSYLKSFEQTEDSTVLSDFNKEYATHKINLELKNLEHELEICSKKFIIVCQEDTRTHNKEAKNE